ncbi:MAG TPA: tetratricopeptide repeat-containing sensor histidine kinase [Cyclobacteriaceae bacterium]
MPFQRKVFFAFMVLSLCLVQSSFAQSDDPEVEWYDSFFIEEKQKSIDESLRIADSRLQDAIEKKDRQAEVKALIGLGLFHLTQVKDYEQALGWLIKSLTLEDSLGFKKEQIFTYLAMAKVFEEVSDYNRSADFLKQARELNNTISNSHLRALILNESGRVNALRGKTEEAFENYELLLEYAEELRQPDREADALFHLGQLLSRQHKYNEALTSHKKALAIRRQEKDKNGESVSLNAIGELYLLMKNNERALANHVAALEIRQALKDTEGLAESFNNVGVLYFQEKNFKRAIANLELALDAGREAQAQVQILKSYDYLSQCFKELKEYKKALEYRESFQGIHEFIQNDKDERQLVEAQNRYVVEQKESEIGQLELIRAQREKQIEAQVKLRNFLFLIIGLGAIIVVLIFYFYILNRRSNRKLKTANTKVQQQNEELQELNATKDKFFSIIGHDLKGPLNSLTSFSSLLINHTDSLTKDEIKMLAKDLDKSLKNLFALLENLLEWSRAQTGSIEFKPEPFDLNVLLEENKELLKAQAQNKKISIVHSDQIPLPVKAHRHSINTVVRNLVANAIKFTPEGGTVTVNAQPGKGEILVSITDTGVGIPASVIEKLFRIDTKHSTKGTADEKGTGLGLILCKEFIEKNGGTIGVQSVEGKGSVFYFTLPV